VQSLKSSARRVSPPSFLTSSTPLSSDRGNVSPFVAFPPSHFSPTGEALFSKSVLDPLSPHFRSVFPLPLLLSSLTVRKKRTTSFFFPWLLPFAGPQLRSPPPLPPSDQLGPTFIPNSPLRLPDIARPRPSRSAKGPSAGSERCLGVCWSFHFPYKKDHVAYESLLLNLHASLEQISFKGSYVGLRIPEIWLGGFWRALGGSCLWLHPISPEVAY